MHYIETGFQIHVNKCSVLSCGFAACGFFKKCESFTFVNDCYWKVKKPQQSLLWLIKKKVWQGRKIFCSLLCSFPRVQVKVSSRDSDSKDIWDFGCWAQIPCQLWASPNQRNPTWSNKLCRKATLISNWSCITLEQVDWQLWSFSLSGCSEMHLKLPMLFSHLKERHTYVHVASVLSVRQIVSFRLKREN